MIVDDAMIVRKSIERFIKQTKLEIVAEANNGKVAVELFQKHLPDIVTLDITMPELDGIGALAQMLAIKPSAKIIMISALNSKNTVVKAVNLGAYAYLLKPWKEEDLAEILNKIMGASR
ncbi:MAG: response regulator [Leptospira sp.]|nr:response regulator [Leptospira sp.]